eukprot:PITA_26698
MQNIFKLHGLPKTIISDHDVKFTSAFWRTLFEGLGTQLNFSIAYHLQTDRQTEWGNQVVEDMLRSYVMQQPSRWGGPEDRLMLGPEMLKEMEEMVKKVEREGEFLVEPMNILDQRKVVLWKRAIAQVKVQWQDFGLDEATWEDELMREAYPELFTSGKHRDDVEFQEGEM